jgi:uncharacterized protein
MLKFEIYLDKKKEFRWKLLSSNGNVIADSGEGYKRRSSCKKSLLKMIAKISLDNFKIIEPQ